MAGKRPAVHHMKIHSFRATIVLAGALWLAGCNSDSSGPPADQVLSGASTNLKSSFAKSAAEEKEMADSVAAAMAEQNYNKAYLAMQQLNASSKLTAEQRELMTKQQAALMQKLREAETQGDKGAMEILQHYRSTK